MIAMGPDGALSEADPTFGLPSTDEYINARHMTHFNLLGAAPTAGAIARWHNRLQELAASTRLGIPVTISTDPRHSFTENPGAAMLSGPFSQWPDALGLAATRDEELVRTFGDIARQEYTAVGIRQALHPQVDLATEPRWARQLQTFGEDAEQDHRPEGQDEGQPEHRAAVRFQAQPAGQFLLEADEGQRGEEDHRALREVEYARCLVDQHETEGDQRVHHPGQQADEQNLDEELHVFALYL